MVNRGWPFRRVGAGAWALLLLAGCDGGATGQQVTSAGPAPDQVPTEVASPPETAAVDVAAPAPSGPLTTSTTAKSGSGDPCAALTVSDYPLTAPGGQPAQLALGTDGAVWFTDNGTAAVGRLGVDGSVRMFAVSAGRQPASIAVGPGGDVWSTQYAFDERPRPVAPGEIPGPPPEPPGPSAIGRISPDGTVSEFPLPTPDDPRSGVPDGRALPRGITAGPDGAMWFAESGFDQIGRISTDGTITEYPLPSGDVPQSFPDGIVAGPDGGLWFREALAGRLGRIDSVTKHITERSYVAADSTPMERTGSGPMIVGPDGAFWAGDSMATITRITTDGTPQSFTIAPPADGIRSLVAGPDGRLWFADQRSAALFRMTTTGTVTHLWTLPGAPKAYESVGGMAVAADGAVWVAQPWANKISRLSCPGLTTANPLDRR